MVLNLGVPQSSPNSLYIKLTQVQPLALMLSNIFECVVDTNSESSLHLGRSPLLLWLHQNPVTLNMQTGRKRRNQAHNSHVS